MRSVRLASPIDFQGWRDAARACLAAGIAPGDVRFTDGAAEGDLFSGADAPPPSDAPLSFRVPRAFMEAAEQGALHSDADRYDLLYRLLWRLKDEHGLMQVASDVDVSRLARMVGAVRRDIHKMHAFVRFRRVEDAGAERFIAWYEPDHHVVEAASPFFARRFANMDWAILTPRACAFHEVGGELAFGPGADRASAPSDDELEELWRSYYASTFNPARPKPGMMRREMPTRFWKNLPEADLIPSMLAGAGSRASAMVDAAPTAPVERAGARLHREDRPMPTNALAALAEEARSCQLCPLWAPATQTVFGEGGPEARLMFVGEQPGDQEDLAGRPFVGPAGQLFNRALQEAGVDRREAYVTNAVKHFKFEPRGKRRIHKKPSVGEIRICSTWLDREIDIIKPRLIVMLGASGAQAVLRRPVTIGKERGRAFSMGEDRTGFITVHPSYILRVPDKPTQDAAYADFVRDLRQVGELAGVAA